MKHSLEFSRIVMEGTRLVTVNVLYYLPDQTHLLNEFLWQTMDVTPTYPRVRSFLTFWEREIDARIKHVTLSAAGYVQPSTWRHGVLFPLD